MAKNLILNCKEVYIGDPCHVIKDNKVYDEICAGDEGTVVEGLGICVSTEGGDGYIEDDEGYEYGIESGQIAILNGDKCDLSVSPDATPFERMWVDSLNIIKVPSGEAYVMLDKDEDTIYIHVEDKASGDILYHAYIRIDNDDEDNEDYDDGEEDDEE